MPTEYFITMDTHCRTTDACIKTARGKLVKRFHVSTSIPNLRSIIESVPRPRRVAFEESAMAGWLYRHLHPLADELIVCDPRRNAYIAKDGDKDDRIDAEKLNDLYRSGHLRKVHQTDSAEKAAVKQLVGMYHKRVAHRVAEGSRLLALGKRWGILLTSAMLARPNAREQIESFLTQAQVPASIIQIANDLHKSFELAAEHETSLHAQICKIAQQDPAIQRAATVPGYGPIRSATLVSYLETPWRFKSRFALYKYVGIGLRRETSGQGLVLTYVEQSCNRLLRDVVIGAALSAIEQKENIFAQRHARWINCGLSPRNARRNVARDQVAAIWGMWKTRTAFDPEMLRNRL